MSQPNCLLILTDHWRPDCLGRFGHPVLETPHLDSLSAKSTVFTNAFSPSPTCLPARRSLMTGLTPSSHGMLGYEDGRPWPYKQTLAGEFKKAGYQTINVGKTHFHPPRLHLGFEQLILPEEYDEWLDRQTGLKRSRFVHGVHGNSWMARPNPLPEQMLEETWLVDQAMERLQKRDPERPFFLCLSFNGPHPPWCPPQYFFDLYMAKDLPEPTVGEWASVNAEKATYPLDVNAWRGKLSPEMNQRARAGYFAYLTYMDAQIGRFIEFLGRAGIFDETMVVFTSDHGEMLGDQNLWRKGYGYEPAAGVPLLVKLPASRQEARRNQENTALVGLEDIMPTFLETAGVPVPETVEGRSLLPLVCGKMEAVRPFYHHEHSPCYTPDNAYQSIVTVDYKFIWNPRTGEEWLFDRAEDPQELVNLAARNDRPSVLEQMRLILAKHLTSRPEGLSDGDRLVLNEVPVWRDPSTPVTG